MAAKRKQHKTYPLNQSPLYRLKSRRKLANLFGISLPELERLAKRKDNYRVFTVNEDIGKPRQVETPKPCLERIHRRVFNLLRRIEPPRYLQSGVKEKSYITNANEHRHATRLITLDIERFFPSTMGWHVFEFFYDSMQCSKDVAGLLTALVTHNNHVPTGSCVSQVMAFYAHYAMFEEINDLAKQLGLKMTCYVDDITLSGDRANASTMYKVRGVVKRRGLNSHPKKEHLYDIGYPKVVTGSVISGGEIKLPNNKHLGLYRDVKKVLKVADLKEREKMLESVIGKAVAASQAEPGMTKLVDKLRGEMSRTKRLLKKT